MSKAKTQQRTLDLCNRAAEMVKDAGFVLHTVSRTTEACYYKWPDREHLLRIAAHSKRSAPPGIRVEMVVGKITFNGCCHDDPGKMKISDSKVEQMVATAIGYYFMRSATPSAREG